MIRQSWKDREYTVCMCARVNNEKKEKDRWKKGDAGELEMENYL
jgi:hypothetical protein